MTVNTWINNWKNMNGLSRTAVIAVGTLVLTIIITVTLEIGFDFNPLSWTQLNDLYFLCLGLCIIAREWKLMISTIIVIRVMFALVVGIGMMIP